METIKSRFDADYASASAVLQVARDCAAKVRPTILPPEGQSADSKLPETFQSIGPLGFTVLEGKTLLALFPPDQPYFELVMEGSIQFSDKVDAETKQKISNALFLRQLLIQSMLETAAIGGANNRRPQGFRTGQRMAISQALITGDSLQQVMDDYRIKTFRRDQYVTGRDSTGDVLYHIVREKIDPLGLNESQFAKTELNKDELAKKNVRNRMQDLFTLCEWDPEKKAWIIKQEMNDRIILTSEEEISPFISTPFDLVLGENYGRGYAELNRGALRTADSLSERLLDFAALCSKQHPVIDHSETTKETDLIAPSGTPFRTTVDGGVATKMGWFGPNKIADFTVCEKALARVEQQLAKAFLLESDATPKGDRVTALQVARVAQELDTTMGGLYSPLADYMQTPLVRRVNYMLERDLLAAKLPKGSYQIGLLTGIAALGRAAAAQRILSFTQVVAGLGPAAVQRLNLSVLVDVFARYSSIYQPGLIKSKEELEREVAEAINAQTKLAAGQKAVDVVGNIAESVATQQAATAA